MSSEAKAEEIGHLDIAEQSPPSTIDSRLTNIEAILERLEKKLDLHSIDLENKTQQIALIRDDISKVESSVESSFQDITSTMMKDQFASFFSNFTASPTDEDASGYDALRKVIQQMASTEVSSLLLGTMEEGLPKPFFKVAQKAIVDLVNSAGVKHQVLALAHDDRKTVIKEVTDLTDSLYTNFQNYAKAINDRIFPNCFFDTETYTITIGMEYLDSPLATIADIADSIQHTPTLEVVSRMIATAATNRPVPESEAEVQDGSVLGSSTTVESATSRDGDGDDILYVKDLLPLGRISEWSRAQGFITSNAIPLSILQDHDCINSDGRVHGLVDTLVTSTLLTSLRDTGIVAAYVQSAIPRLENISALISQSLALPSSDIANAVSTFMRTALCAVDSPIRESVLVSLSPSLDTVLQNVSAHFIAELRDGDSDISNQLLDNVGSTLRSQIVAALRDLATSSGVGGLTPDATHDVSDGDDGDGSPEPGVHTAAASVADSGKPILGRVLFDLDRSEGDVTSTGGDTTFPKSALKTKEHKSDAVGSDTSTWTSRHRMSISVDDVFTPAPRYASATKHVDKPGFLLKDKAIGVGWSKHTKRSTGKVNWMLPGKKGPYGGVPKTIMNNKNITYLRSDDYDDVLACYNGVRTLLKVSEYHGDGLMPAWKDFENDADLTKTPIFETDMRCEDDLQWSTPGHWNESHMSLGHVLFMYLESTIKPEAIMCRNLIRRNAALSNGWDVLQGLLRLHHPRAYGNQAPSWNSVLGDRPTQAEGEPHTIYFTKYDVWMERCALYLEFGYTTRNAQFALWFIDGMTHKHRVPLATRRDELVGFERKYRSLVEEPALASHLTIDHMAMHLEMTIPINLKAKKSTKQGGTFIADVRLNGSPKDLQVASIRQTSEQASASTLSSLTSSLTQPVSDSTTRVSSISEGVGVRFADDRILTDVDVQHCMNDASFQKEFDAMTTVATGNGFSMNNGVQTYVCAVRMKSMRRNDRNYQACSKPFCQGRVHEVGACCICNGRHDTTACWLLPGKDVPDNVRQRIQEVAAAISRGDLVRESRPSLPSKPQVGSISLAMVDLPDDYIQPQVNAIGMNRLGVSADSLSTTLPSSNQVDSMESTAPRSSHTFGSFLETGALGDDDVEEIRSEMRVSESLNPYLLDTSYARHKHE